MSEEQRKLFMTFIGQMSYYNAAEGSYMKEASERNAFRKTVKITLCKWMRQGISIGYMKALFDTNRGLCRFSDLLTETEIKAFESGKFNGEYQH